MNQNPTLEGIAVIGIAGRFPQARTCDELWQNLCAGRESIRRFTDEELAAAGHDVSALGPRHVRAAAVIDDATGFDAGFFGYTPREAEIMDPQQRLFLETVWEALENAGYDADRLPGAVGLYAGMANNSYYPAILSSRPDILEPFGMFPAMILNEKDYLATRVAYKLNLRGPSVTVQTACSTSLVAVCHACQSLLTYQADLAIAGGVCVEFPQARAYLHEEGGITSSDGHCRPFDAAASGTVPGEGVGAVILRRLEDAVAAGDRILAVIKGSALNNDGSDKAGFTAPSVGGQAEVIALAQALAGFSPDTISYIEAHGTATPLGDPIEFAGLTQAFRRGTDRNNFCGLGALKSNFGHLDAAAGVAGLIKTVLALSHRKMPPTLHFSRPNPQIDFSNSPFYVVDRLMDWPEGPTPRRAGVSSFGLGGTNAHVVLEEAPASVASSPGRPWELVVLSARTAPALEAATDRLADYFRGAVAAEFADACCTLQTGRRQFTHRRFVVCRDPADAAVLLSARDGRRVRTAAPDRRDAAVVFMLPGQGAQHVDMGRELHAAEPVFRAELDRCAVLLEPALGLDLRTLLFPAPEDTAWAEKQLGQTRFTQPALFAVEYALARLWQSWGVQPSALIGHSLGEYVAACLAGVFSLEDGLRLIGARAGLVQQQPQGAMLAVRLSEAAVTPFLNGHLSLAAVNAAQLCVVAGPTDAVAALEAGLAEKHIASRRLSTSHAFHSAMMDPVVEPLLAVLRSIPLRAPKIPIMSNVTGRWLTTEEATNPDYWARQVRGVVRFADGLARLCQEPGRVLLEVGPGATLSTLARQFVGRAGTHTVVASMPAAGGLSEWPSLLEAVGQSWQAGVTIDWPSLQAGAIRQRVALPTYPFERRVHWIEPRSIPVPPAETLAATAVAPKRLDLDAVPAPLGAAPTDLETVGLRTTSILAQLRQVLHEISGVSVDELPEAATFMELGFDSLFLTQASRAFENKVGVKITLRHLLDDYPTLSDLAAYAERQRPSGPGTTPAVVPTEPNAAATLPVRPVAVVPGPAAAMGPFKPISRHTEAPLPPRQQAHLAELIARYTARTASSRKLTQQHRARFADPRAVTGFQTAWKGMVYPLVADRSAGSRLWDIDGNEYVDITMGFGLNLLGHSPDFVSRAITEQLRLGIAIGPQSRQAFEVAELIGELTGLERVSFCNTGSEAVMAALRMARTVTGRDRFVCFAGDYHGVFDEVLVRAGAAGRAFPISPGIPVANVGQVHVLEYGAPASLDFIRQHAAELAAVMIEPVQSRRPDHQPAEFVRELRRITETSGTALIFDEIVTGFRLGPDGAQGLFGVKADLATYGKVIGGGLPIGAVAGSRRFMDALDGGHWNYDDASFPEVGVTFFAGTFIRHPLAMAAAKAVLTHLKTAGPTLQRDLNARCTAFLGRLQASLQRAGAPVSLPSCGSMFMLKTAPDVPHAALLLYELRARGIYVWENRACFLSTAHTDADLAQIEQAFHESVAALQEGGFFPPRPAEDVSIAPTPPSQSGGDTAIPLTEAQKEIWLAVQRGDEASRAFNEVFQVTMRGTIGFADFERALGAMVARHDALRTTFLADGSGQRVSPLTTLPLSVIDLKGHSGPDLNSEIVRLRDEIASAVFNLAHGPLFRAVLIRVAEEHHELLLACHHLICDGWSGGVLLSELRTLCVACSRQQSWVLPAAMQYPDYVAWLNAPAQRERLAAAEAYWLKAFGDRPAAVELPRDRVRPARMTYRAGRTHAVFEAELVGEIKKAAARLNVTLLGFLLASFKGWLHRTTGQVDLIVAIPAAGQNAPDLHDRPESRNLVGHAVNLLPIRTPCDGVIPFKEFVRTVKGRLLDAFENQSFTFGTLVEKLGLPRDASRVPLVSVIFNLDRAGGEAPADGLTWEVSTSAPPFCFFDLGVNAVETGGRIKVEYRYNSDLFTPETIAGWVAQWQCFITAATRAPETPLARLPVLSWNERNRILDAGTGPVIPGGTRALCVHELIADQAARTPEAAAVVFDDRSLTYRELNTRANQLAHHLQSRGVGPEVTVAIAMERSLDLIVALLAVLKAGGAYLPIDPSYPAARIAHMLHDAVPLLLLTERKLAPRFVAEVAATICVDEEWPVIRRASEEDPASSAALENLAYIIYTSGSTGRPKGVLLHHRGMTNLVQAQVADFNIAGKRVLQFASISFDASVSEIFPALASGATLYLLDQDIASSPVALAHEINRHRIDVVTLPPSLLAVLSPASVPDLGTIISVGEACPWDLADKWKQGRRFINGYGPSEATVGPTFYEVNGRREGTIHVPIGRPIANMRVHVLDAGLNPVAIGVTGELYIGGVGIARGYLNLPELTAEKFVADPFADRPGARLYRTGDLARLLPDGNLEFLGRGDHQVKLRGFRIELGEIETVLRQHPTVQDAAVIAWGPSVTDQQLAAFVVLRAGASELARELREHVKASLPPFMVPSAVVFLPALPLSPNGKVDRAALARQSLESGPAKVGAIAPRNEVEAELFTIWKQVLKHDQFGVTDDFFEMGGHSLLAVRLSLGIEQRFGRKLTLGQLLDGPTIEAIAQGLRESTMAIKA